MRIKIFWLVFLFPLAVFSQTLLDDYDATDSLTYSVNGAWTKNTVSGVYEAHTGGKRTPEHSYASYDLNQKISGWTLNKDYINVWFGWMDLNRSSVSGWGANSYSCAMILAANSSDFNNSTTKGYAIGFKNTGDYLVVFRFDAGIVDGTAELPGTSTEIVNSGYAYNDLDNGVNFYVELLPNGYWKVYYKAGSQLSASAAVNKANYSDGSAISSSAETTYSGSTYKYAGWAYAHSSASSNVAYFDNFGAGMANQWTGAVSTSWNTAGNWTAGSVPGSSSYVAIPDVSGGSGNFPVISTHATCEHLSIHSGSHITVSAGYSLTVNGVLANNNGNSGIVLKSSSSGTGALITTTSGISGTIERYLTTGGYHYFSSPISSLSATEFPISSYMKVFTYTESSNSWSVVSSGNLNVGQGYLIYPKSTLTKSITGTFNTGTINVTVSATDISGGTPGTVDANEGWNLIGNPYPSPITIKTSAANDFIDANSSVIYGNIYFWDDDGTNGSGYGTSDYAVWNGTGYASGGNGTQPDGIVEPGQAFFVQLKNIGSGQTVTFTDNMRTQPDASPVYFSYLNEVTFPRFWLNMVSENKRFFNQILIGFPPEATSGRDDNYDAPKLRGNDSFAFYSLLDHHEMMIQGLAPADEADIHLGYECLQEGNYTIALDNYENLSGESLILEDCTENRKINLLTEKQYTFRTPAGRFDDRFIVHFTNKSNNVEDLQRPGTVKIPVYSANHKITVDLTQFDGDFSISIYDVAGRKLFEHNLRGNSIFEQEVSKRGLFFVVISGEDFVQYRRVIIF